MREELRCTTTAGGVPSAHTTKATVMLPELSAKSWAILMPELVQYHLVLEKAVNPFGCRICTVMERRSQWQGVTTLSGITRFVTITHMTCQCPV